MIDQLNVINLDRTPERWAGFVAANPAIPSVRFPAADGRFLARDACVRDGLLKPENTYNPGAIGVAMSHVTLWRRCVNDGVPLHVAEDDIVLRRDFMAAARDALASLVEWDIVLWTHNVDWPVMIRPSPGVGDVVMQYAHERTGRDVDVFRSATEKVILAPMVSAAGIACYSISPRGAARLLENCLPIGNKPSAYVARPGQPWLNSGIDVEMTRHYASMRAYLALTPLAYSSNDQSMSTIRGHLAAMHDPAIANKAVV